MNLGDLVRIRSEFSRDGRGEIAYWKLFDEPHDNKKLRYRGYVGTFTLNQFGTVLGYSVEYIDYYRVERRDVKVLVGDCVGWIEDRIICKVEGTE